MVLLPTVHRSGVPSKKAFATCVALILPLCLVSAAVMLLRTDFDWEAALPYLIGSALGGILAGLLGKRIPTVWLHRGLGILILWGGYRYLC